jgi:glucose-6-phosphate isomerase
MDEHFRTAPLEQNVPVVLGLLGVWYNELLRRPDARHPPLRPVHAPLRRLLPAGRHGEQRQARRPQGARIDDYSTGPIVWGEPGTNGQHAFYQLIHQGTRSSRATSSRRSRRTTARQAPPGAARELLRADRGADEGQDARRGARGARRAEAAGRAESNELVPHKTFPGNRPTTSILFTEAHAADAGHAHRAVRAQDLHAGRSSGTSTASTSGAWSWASSSPRRSSRSWRAAGP